MADWLFTVGETSSETLAQLAQETYTNAILELLIGTMDKLDFEARKDSVLFFNTMVRRQIGSRTPTVEYISHHCVILASLIHGYEKQELALNFGMMLRECLRHEHLAQIFLNSPEFFLLFDHVQQPTFDIASDAFATLKVSNPRVIAILL